MWYILAAVWIRMERWRAVLSTLCDRRASVDRVSTSLCIEEPAFVRGIVPLVDVGQQRQRQRAAAPGADPRPRPPPRHSTAPDFPQATLCYFVACGNLSVTVLYTVR